MREAIKQMKPNKFDDIIALVALYRPGPMSNIPIYNDCKNGSKEPDYIHPTLKEILKTTYGIIIYQEQVMQIAQTLAGFTAGEADILRRAMGKRRRPNLINKKKGSSMELLKKALQKMLPILCLQKLSHLLNMDLTKVMQQPTLLSHIKLPF